MKARLLQYAVGAALATASMTAGALPFTVTGASGLPGAPTPVTVTLNDGATVALEAATVLIQFDPARLDYLSAAVGNLFPLGTIAFENLLDEALGSVIVAISSNDNPLTGGSGSLLDVRFGILANAPIGLTAVTFRCVPADQALAVDAVTDQTSANDLCPPDYAIPATSGDVNVLARQTSPVPISGTVSLTLLGLGLIGWLVRRRPQMR